VRFSGTIATFTQIPTRGSTAFVIDGRGAHGVGAPPPKTGQHGGNPALAFGPRRQMVVRRTHCPALVPESASEDACVVEHSVGNGGLCRRITKEPPQSS
jgi:hypothetical protein